MCQWPPDAESFCACHSRPHKWFRCARRTKGVGTVAVLPEAIRRVIKPADTCDESRTRVYLALAERSWLLSLSRAIKLN